MKTEAVESQEALADLHRQRSIVRAARRVNRCLLLEHYWRRQLPRFFPDGDLSAVRGALRFPVRVRLLAIFVMTSVIPLMLLGVLSYTRALGLLGADPSAAAQIVESMRLIILFILAVGVAAAVGLSIFAANSVAGPLRRLS